jgi:hypothetical protein
MTLRLNWLGSLTAEAGGPCILGDTSAFPEWTSSGPIPGSEAKTLRLWGQFTADLPAKFRPNGKTGHQFVAYESHAAAMAGLEELRGWIRKKWPGANESLRITKTSADGSISLPDHRSMQLQLIEPNHYELMCEAIGPGPGTYVVSPKAKFFVFVQEGAGVVHVGATQARDELVLMRWWIDEDEHEAIVRERVDAPRKEKREGSWSFTSTAAAVLWSPVRFSDLKGVTAPKLKELAKAESPIDAKVLRNVGFAMTVRPGTYAVSSGIDEGEGWSALWCRLTLKR